MGALLSAMRDTLALALSRRVARNALQVSAVVGCNLNGVNQGGRILNGHDVSGWHVLLNFLVPYAVATYSAVRNERDRREGPPAQG